MQLVQLIQPVYAQVQTVVPTFGLDRFQTLKDIFGFVVNLIIGVGWSLVFIMVALGFVKYVMSKGEKTAVQTAQQLLTYAIIGGVGLFFVMVLKNIIIGVLSPTFDPNAVGGNITL